MLPAQWERVKEVFDSVSDLPPDNRAAVLDSSCGNDGLLRSEVERLLAEYDRAGVFLDDPLIDPGRSLQNGELVNGRYEVVRLVGRGGMGEVYEAQDRVLNERIAIKTLRPELAGNPAMLSRFQREIRSARKVTHPNVCRVFEVGVHAAGLHYFTMELLPGETLAARIAHQGGLKAPEAFPLIRQMAEGLHAAHMAGVVHRDFKSANVMLVGGRAVITDFGLAGAGHAMAMAAGANAGSDTSTASVAGQVAGTLGYMSPEQFAGGAVTTASDIYSFGVVLFEMAAARLPFDGTHVINAAMQRVSGQIPGIRALAPDIDPRWESAIERCLAPAPEKRFASAADLAAHFSGSGTEMPARPPHSDSRMRQPRRLWWAAVAAAALCLAAVGGAWRMWPARIYTPKPEAVPWMEKSVDAALSMTYESARKAAQKAVSLDPGYAPAHAYLAAALAELDDLSGANDEMLKAVSIAQRTRFSAADSARVAGLQHMVAREFDASGEAFSQLETLAASEPERAAAHLHASWLHQKRQNLPAMQASIEQALKFNPASAGARLRLALVLAQKQDADGALKAFAEAEDLFRAATDLDGVAEVLWQQSRFLARINRSAEAIQLADRGLSIAASTNNYFHAIRLQLVRAFAFRNSGRLAESRQVAEQAVQQATERHMDQSAAIGLLDLGNAYLQAGEPEPAERYFQQGLDAARRGRAEFSEARAALSLGSLYVQYGKTAQALARIEAAAPFFQNGGYRREATQALLLLGSARAQLARYADAETSFRQAEQQAVQLQDREQRGLVHGMLSMVYLQTGRWPEAEAAATKAVELFGDLRGGYRAAYQLAGRARIRAALGNFDGARADIAESSRWLSRASGKQNQIRSRLALADGEIAYEQGLWAQAAAQAKAAAALHGGDEEDLEAGLLAALCSLRTGGSSASARDLIGKLDKAGELYLAAKARLAFAESAGEESAGSAAATEALRFFEEHRNWEGIWRCHRALGRGVEHAAAARAALDELRRSWPASHVAAYLARPDVKKLAEF